MRLGFCSIVERDSPSRVFRRLVDGLQAAGVQLSNPDTHAITALVGDGAQWPTSSEGLLTRLVREGGVTFQLWFAGDTDLDCSIAVLGEGLVRHNYSLDGLTPGERKLVVSWAEAHFHRACEAGTAVLGVIDVPGITADADWDAIATGHSLPLVLPQFLGVPAARLSGLEVETKWVIEQIGEMAVLRKIPRPAPRT